MVALPETISLVVDPEVEAALEMLGDTYGDLPTTLKVAILNLAEEHRQARIIAAAGETHGE